MDAGQSDVHDQVVENHHEEPTETRTSVQIPPRSCVSMSDPFVVSSGG